MPAADAPRSMLATITKNANHPVAVLQAIAMPNARAPAPPPIAGAVLTQGQLGVGDGEEPLVDFDRLVSRSGGKQRHCGCVTAVHVWTTTESAFVPHVHDVGFVEARVDASERDIDQVVGRPHLLVWQELTHGPESTRDHFFESARSRSGDWCWKLDVGRGSRFRHDLAKLNEPMIERYVGKQIENWDVDSGAGQ